MGKKDEFKKNSYLLDLWLWGCWVVLMWGFLAILTVTDSPKDSPGIHEVIILAYFLGFSGFSAFLYYLILRKGV